MKVNVDKSNLVEKSLHNLIDHNSTTADFGFVQPLMVDELQPDAVANIRVGQVFRLNPMVSPTFGDIQLKTYINYVKSEDLFHPFPNLLAQQSYKSSVHGSYIPQQVPTISPAFYYCILRATGRFNAYDVTYTPFNNSEYAGGITIENASISSAVASTVKTALFSFWNTNFDFPDSKFTTKFPKNLVWDSSIVPTGCDWATFVTVGSKLYLVFGRYGTFAKNLLKIFVGSGYEFNESTKPVSLMELFAYYKSWFDLFMPSRTITWTDTACFGFIEYLEQYGKIDYVDWSGESAALDLFLNFIEELTGCYYTMNVDFASAHVDGQGNAIGTNASQFNYLDALNQPQVGGIVGPNNGAAIEPQTYNSINQSALRVLKAMDKRVNTQSVLGGRISELLKSIYGSNYKEYESNLIGTQILSANIDDVMSTADTDTGFLGEYAGKGLGSSPGKEFKFSAHEGTKFGYIVILAAVVPVSRMSQGFDMQLKHVYRNDFFDKNFDAITLLPTEKKFIYGCQDIVSPNIDSEDYTAGFGNIPNYIEYKTKKNITNGDMRMMSTRDSYLPFTLDRLLPYGSLIQTGSANILLRNVDLNWIVNGEKWRYIGKYPFLGNYDRIFENSGFEAYYQEDYQSNESFFYDRLDDNFIIHNYIDYKKLDTGCEIADSWQTDAYGDHLSVEEA